MAKIIGKIVATFPASDHAPLHYRILDRQKNYALWKMNQKWSSRIVLSTHSLEELRWWHTWLFSEKLQRSLHIPKISCEIFTDSSKNCWGAKFNRKGDAEAITVQNKFTMKQCLLPINTKELMAVLFGLTSFKNMIKGENILLHCDNTTAIACIKRKGTSHFL